jgi:hypothetical protein
MNGQDRAQSVTVESGVCRDLVADGFLTVWVGLVVEDGVDRVAAAGAGAGTLSDRVVDHPTVTDAITAGEPRLTQTAPTE